MAEPRVEAEALRLAGDVRLGHVQQRRVDGKTLALDARLRRNIREALEFVDELRPAIGIAGIIERIHTDVNVARAARFAQAQRKAQEDRVARWHVGNRDPLTHPILRDIDVAGQRRAAESPQVERQDDVPVGKLRCDSARRVQLDAVTLPVVDRQRRDLEPGFARERGAHHGIEPAGQKDDRAFQRSIPIRGAAQNHKA